MVQRIQQSISIILVSIICRSTSGKRSVGQEETINGNLVAYVVNKESPKDATAIVWAHDLYEYESERIRALVDLLASKTGFTVMMPDFMGGKRDIDKYSWDNRLRVWSLQHM